MADNARGIHVSPGIYTREVDLNYASKSLGITTLGLAGETVKGPAFQPITIENWRQYQQYFGGTNTEKYRGSQYPKYELPYVAQSYLKQSNQLEVVRVLGLSGVNAGPAWVVTASKDGGTYDKMEVFALRSRGEHKKASFVAHKGDTDPDDPSKTLCEDKYEYDSILYYAKDVVLEPSKSLSFGDECNPSASITPDDPSKINVDVNNYGRFTVVVTLNNDDVKRYSVSLNPGEKNFIINVLGTNPEIGESEVYVEELYDIALEQLIERGEIDAINTEPVKYEHVYIVPKYDDVDDILTYEEDLLTRKDVGKRFLYSSSMSKNGNENALNVHVSTDKGKSWTEMAGTNGHIYTVIPFTTSEGTRKYYYGEYNSANETDDKWKPEVLTGDRTVDEVTRIFDNAVKVRSYESFFVSHEGDVKPIRLDLNNYKEEYRFASTPWVLSEMKGDAENVELNRLFRFHTISDGNSSNTEVKISIENIEPEYGTFDVLVRDFHDTDAAPVVYERFKGVNLIPGDSNYISLRIGSFDDEYENMSKFITVEVNENDKTTHSIPAGFMGYPVRDYEGLSVIAIDDAKKPTKPFLMYNTNVDEDIRINKQYFGLSNITGIDEDILRYKGVEAYDEEPNGLTPCFHLDSRILEEAYKKQYSLTQNVSIDGVTGYDFVSVGVGNQTLFGIEPRIGDEETMEGTIYEDKRYRKFTFAFCGGFDGWDYYRTSRGNSDDFKFTKYKGRINKESGSGTMLSVIKNPENYGFGAGDKILNSDYYAYLSAYRKFANPKAIDINVFATPGIDYVNQNSLVGEVITMIEEERADSVYVVTTPDKPYGASDAEGEMYTPSDAVDNLDDSEIDSNYTCSYYPWCKYYDEDSNKYIYLPPTRDVVRNFAYTDNTKYPWFAAAGWYRGEIEDNGVKPKKSLKLGEQDTLYAGRLNFINTFAKEGMKIWGDKNMQIRESQMNRISKRRLLIRIRKLCSIACIGLIFDPNDNTTKQSFESAITPILDNVMSNRGITDWRLEIDDSQEARDRLELPAKIYIKPQPNLEYISIDFVITPQGTNWSDI